MCGQSETSSQSAAAAQPKQRWVFDWNTHGSWVVATGEFKSRRSAQRAMKARQDVVNKHALFTAKYRTRAL